MANFYACSAGVKIAFCTELATCLLRAAVITELMIVIYLVGIMLLWAGGLRGLLRSKFII